MVRQVLAGVRRYGAARRLPRPPEMPEVARIGRARLLDYGVPGDARAPAVLFVPSLINPPHVLDMADGNSLLRWLARQGVRPLLLDWGDPRACDHAVGGGLSIGGHVEALLLPLIDALGMRVALVGYCLGGTMALAAAALRPVAGVATLAAPWDFDHYPEDARAGAVALWEAGAPLAARLGLFPMELLQAGFWQIDPARSFAKYADFADLDPDTPAARAFVALEDWANQGPPLSHAAAQELLIDLFRDNRTGDLNWQVGGVRIDPAALGCPQLAVVSSSDRIVPAATAPPADHRAVLARGHVGMVVGRGAEAGLWAELRQWLSQLQYNW